MAPHGSCRAAAATGRHPIFAHFPPATDPAPGNFWTDCLGVRIRRAFHAHYDDSNGVGYLQPHIQPILSEYFEWISLLCAAAAARPPFTMFELGSGWGRWILRGALACRRLSKEFQLAGVEAEPRHFDWMKTAFRDNDVDPDAHLLVNAAVGAAAGEAWFLAGNSRGWYGQSLLAADQLQWAHEEASRYRDAGSSSLAELQTGVHKVPLISLRELLVKYTRVHLLNVDIQNAEADVVEAAAEEIDARVELAHISTHSPEVERRLRVVFDRLGWLRIFDFACQGQRSTPYGEVGFIDGAQTWINPTAGTVLDWFCEPALYRYSAVETALLQQKKQQAQEIHALERRALEEQLQTALRQKQDAEARIETLSRELERERNVSISRVLARKFPRLARGVKHILPPLRQRRSA